MRFLIFFVILVILGVKFLTNVISFFMFFIILVIERYFRIFLYIFKILRIFVLLNVKSNVDVLERIFEIILSKND